MPGRAFSKSTRGAPGGAGQGKCGWTRRSGSSSAPGQGGGELHCMLCGCCIAEVCLESGWAQARALARSGVEPEDHLEPEEEAAPTEFAEAEAERAKSC